MPSSPTRCCVTAPTADAKNADPNGACDIDKSPCSSGTCATDKKSENSGCTYTDKGEPPKDADSDGKDHSHGSSCGCDPLAEDDPDHKKELYFILSCALFFAVILFFEEKISAVLGAWSLWILYGVPYLLCGFTIFKTALQLVKRKDFFNEFTLMTGATVAALILGEVPEAVGVMLFYRLGEYVQDRAASGSRKSIQKLLAERPTRANVLVDGNIVEKDVEEVLVNDTLLVRVGEKFPVDGVVLSGSSEVDQSPLTGESLPVFVEAGSTILGGSINLSAVLNVQATSLFTDSHMARILHLVEEAARVKSPTERFITRFARYYTPLVVVLAVLVAVLTPFIMSDVTFNESVYRALVLLVISCPCALLISIPLGYFGGIGAASRKGILVKGGTVFDALLHVTTVVFDKTGTLTKGALTVAGAEPSATASETELLQTAAEAEQYSNHPIAKAIVAYAQEKGIGVNSQEQKDVSNTSSNAFSDKREEVGGKGLVVHAKDGIILAGTAKLLLEHDIKGVFEKPFSGAEVHVSKNGTYLGVIWLADSIKEDTPEALQQLHALGKKTYMLTGDNATVAKNVAEQIGIGGFIAGLLPEGKVEAMQKLASSREVAFVGDGINDAPILTHAGVGIAMGDIGAEAAIEAADVVIVNDSLSNVVTLFGLAKRVRTIVWQNIVLAIGLKSFIMALGIAGMSGLWEAVFADVGVALLAVLNSTRVR